MTGKAATDYVNKWIAQNKESRIAENSAKNQEKSQGVLSDLRHFNIGNSYMIPVSAQITPATGFVNAKFLGFKMKDKINPSSIIASFATHDGRRKVDIPLSQVNFMNAIKARRTTAWEMLSDEKWDNTIPTSTRKTAYIATGNLLQAYATEKGQLVTFTTKDGSLRKGILMPDNYKAEDQKTKVPIHLFGMLQIYLIVVSWFQNQSQYHRLM